MTKKPLSFKVVAAFIFLLLFVLISVKPVYAQLSVGKFNFNLTNNSLWKLEFHKHGDPAWVHTVSSSQVSNVQFYSTDATAQTMTYTGTLALPEGNIDYTVRVDLTATGSPVGFKADIEVDHGPVPHPDIYLAHYSFPDLSFNALDINNEKLIVPWHGGFIADNFVKNGYRIFAPHPSLLSLPIFAYYNPKDLQDPTMLVLFTDNPEGDYKEFDIKGDPNTGLLHYSAIHFPSDITETVHKPNYSVYLYVIPGDSPYEPATLYRNEVLTKMPWYKGPFSGVNSGRTDLEKQINFYAFIQPQVNGYPMNADEGRFVHTSGTIQWDFTMHDVTDEALSYENVFGSGISVAYGGWHDSRTNQNLFDCWHTQPFDYLNPGRPHFREANDRLNNNSTPIISSLYQQGSIAVDPYAMMPQEEWGAFEWEIAESIILQEHDVRTVNGGFSCPAVFVDHSDPFWKEYQTTYLASINEAINANAIYMDYWLGTLCNYDTDQRSGNPPGCGNRVYQGKLDVVKDVRSRLGRHITYSYESALGGEVTDIAALAGNNPLDSRIPPSGTFWLGREMGIDHDDLTAANLYKITHDNILSSGPSAVGPPGNAELNSPRMYIEALKIISAQQIPAYVSYLANHMPWFATNSQTQYGAALYESYFRSMFKYLMDIKGMWRFHKGTILKPPRLISESPSFRFENFPHGIKPNSNSVFNKDSVPFFDMHGAPSGFYQAPLDDPNLGPEYAFMVTNPFPTENNCVFLPGTSTAPLVIEQVYDLDLPKLFPQYSDKDIEIQVISTKPSKDRTFRVPANQRYTLNVSVDPLETQAYVMVVNKGTAPATTPAVTTSTSTYDENEPITVSFTDAPGNATDWIGLYKAGAANTNFVRWAYINGKQNGSLSFTPGLSAGNYEARLLVNDSFVSVASVSFNVKQSPVSNPPRVVTNAVAYAADARITVNYTDAPGNTADWVALYRTGTTNREYLKWSYTSGVQNGSVTFSPGLSEGNYEARLLVNGSFTSVASASFSVSAPPQPQPSAQPKVTMSASTYGANASITVNFTDAPGNTKDWIGLYKVGESNKKFVKWSYINGTRNGSVQFASGLLAGSYEARLLVNDSYTSVAKTSFSIQGSTSSNTPKLTTSAGVYGANRPITVNFTDLPGNAKDWVGLYRVGSGNSNFVAWVYTDGTKTGTAGIKNGSVTFASGLASGSYEARALVNDSYTSVATVSFSVN